MAHKLVQALQVVSMSLLQGCSHNLSGNGLRGQQGLRGEVRPGSGPVQALCSTMSTWWTTSWSSTTWWTSSSARMLVAAMAMGAMVVLAILVSMVPRRGRGAQRGGGRGVPERRDEEEAQREGSEGSVPVPGEAGGATSEEGTRGRREDRASGSTEERSRSLRGGRHSATPEEEDPSGGLHRKIALMYMTIVEGRFVPREPVTPQGMLTTLKHLLGASRSLDDGYYFTIKDAMDRLDSDEEWRARDLLQVALARCERVHGALPNNEATLSRFLFQRYQKELRAAGYPVQRLRDMVLGPDSPDSTESYTEEHRPFRSDASRSRDSERLEVEGEEDRRVTYRMSSMGSVSAPELWMEIHHFESDDEERSGDTGRGGERNNNGGEEPDGEPGFGDGGEGPDFEPGPFTAMVQMMNREAARVGVPRPGGPRDPVTYPPIQQDEMQGAYPGAGVDLTPYSTYEKVTRMIECYHARLVECEYANEPDRYEEILREIKRLEELQVLADDVRPDEMANLPAGV